MKNLLVVLLGFFILVGCAQKPVIVQKSNTIKKEKPIIQKSKTEVVEEQEVIVVEEDFIHVEDINNLNRIAVVYPSKIVGKYAKSTLATVSAFLLFDNKPFEIETFDTYVENSDNILEQLNSINEKGFTKVIALFTQNGFDILNSLEESKNLNIYFPLINKSEVFTQNENFIFGGISYQKQMELLQSLSSDEKNTMFYVKSYLGNKLRDSYFNTFNPGIVKEIQRKNNKFKYIMEDERMIGTAVILNTPIIKSSIIMSQLTAFEIAPSMILSTQLNYNPLLLKLTQDRDREKFYVVSAISEVNSFIEDYSKLLGSDVKYNWVDYSSLVGINYLINKNESQIIKSEIIDNQVNYEKTLYKSTLYGFQKVFTN